MNLRERFRTSLFFKLVVLFLFAHLTIGTIGISVHRFFKMRYHEKSIIKNMAHYSHFIATEIGSPADTSRARQLCKNYNILMQIRSDNTVIWESSPSSALFALFQDSVPAGNDSLQTALIGPRFMVQSSQDSIEYLMGFDIGSQQESSALELRILIMVLTMMTILILLYIAIRRILRPIGEMAKAVDELSAGNLEYQLETRSRDELGELNRSFNDMTHRLREMLQARDQLLLDASHELRSPLTRVKVALEFVEDEQVRQTINDDISEMETMVGELLESERLNSPYGGLHLQKIDLVQLIEKLNAEQSNTKPGIEYSGSISSLSIMADPERLKIALKNLIQNALKYSEPDGKPVQVKLEQDALHALIRILDFGKGIPESDLAFIFEPFYRVDKSRSKNTGGYGLGLSLTQKIIDAHKGKIEVNSRPGQGTEFVLRLKKN